MKALFLFLVLLPDRPHVNYYVPGEAIERAELVDCDYDKPPNCRAVNLVYKSGSERLIGKSVK